MSKYTNNYLCPKRTCWRVWHRNNSWPIFISNKSIMRTVTKAEGWLTTALSWSLYTQSDQGNLKQKRENCFENQSQFTLMSICGVGIHKLHHIPIPVVALTIKPSVVKAGEGKEMEQKRKFIQMSRIKKSRIRNFLASKKIFIFNFLVCLVY